jgi:hypothetical protein
MRFAAGGPGIGVLDWLRPVHVPRQSEIAIDGVVMVWTAGLTVISSMAFGLVPALAFTRDAHGQSLRAGSLQLRSRRLHRGLVLSEVALSIVPLIAAGLMLRTLSIFSTRRSASIRRTSSPPGSRSTSGVFDDRSPLGVLSGCDRPRARAARRRAASVGGALPLAPVQATQRVWRSEDREPTPAIGVLQSLMPGYFG